MYRRELTVFFVAALSIAVGSWAFAYQITQPASTSLAAAIAATAVSKTTIEQANAFCKQKLSERALAPWACEYHDIKQKLDLRGICTSRGTCEPAEYKDIRGKWQKIRKPGTSLPFSSQMFLNPTAPSTPSPTNLSVCLMYGTCPKEDQTNTVVEGTPAVTTQQPPTPESRAAGEMQNESQGSGFSSNTFGTPVGLSGEKSPTNSDEQSSVVAGGPSSTFTPDSPGTGTSRTQGPSLETLRENINTATDHVTTAQERLLKLSWSASATKEQIQNARAEFDAASTEYWNAKNAYANAPASSRIIDSIQKANTDDNAKIYDAQQANAPTDATPRLARSPDERQQRIDQLTIADTAQKAIEARDRVASCLATGPCTEETARAIISPDLDSDQKKFLLGQIDAWGKAKAGDATQEKLGIVAKNIQELSGPPEQMSSATQDLLASAKGTLNAQALPRTLESISTSLRALAAQFPSSNGLNPGTVITGTLAGLTDDFSTVFGLQTTAARANWYSMTTGQKVGDYLGSLVNVAVVGDVASGGLFSRTIVGGLGTILSDGLRYSALQVAPGVGRDVYSAMMEIAKSDSTLGAISLEKNVYGVYELPKPFGLTSEIKIPEPFFSTLTPGAPADIANALGINPSQYTNPLKLPEAEIATRDAAIAELLYSKLPDAIKERVGPMQYVPAARDTGQAVKDVYTLNQDGTMNISVPRDTMMTDAEFARRFYQGVGEVVRGQLRTPLAGVTSGQWVGGFADAMIGPQAIEDAQQGATLRPERYAQIQSVVNDLVYKGGVDFEGLLDRPQIDTPSIQAVIPEVQRPVAIAKTEQTVPEVAPTPAIETRPTAQIIPFPVRTGQNPPQIPGWGDTPLPTFGPYVDAKTLEEIDAIKKAAFEDGKEVKKLILSPTQSLSFDASAFVRNLFEKPAPVVGEPVKPLPSGVTDEWPVVPSPEPGSSASGQGAQLVKQPVITLTFNQTGSGNGTAALDAILPCYDGCTSRFSGVVTWSDGKEISAQVSYYKDPIGKVVDTETLLERNVYPEAGVTLGRKIIGRTPDGLGVIYEIPKDSQASPFSVNPAKTDLYAQLPALAWRDSVGRNVSELKAYWSDVAQNAVEPSVRDAAGQRVAIIDKEYADWQAEQGRITNKLANWTAAFGLGKPAEVAVSSGDPLVDKMMMTAMKGGQIGIEIPKGAYNVSPSELSSSVVLPGADAAPGSMFPVPTDAALHMQVTDPSGKAVEVALKGGTLVETGPGTTVGASTFLGKADLPGRGQVDVIYMVFPNGRNATFIDEYVKNNKPAFFYEGRTSLPLGGQNFIVVPRRNL